MLQMPFRAESFIFVENIWDNRWTQKIPHSVQNGQTVENAIALEQRGLPRRIPANRLKICSPRNCYPLQFLAKCNGYEIQQLLSRSEAVSIDADKNNGDRLTDIQLYIALFGWPLHFSSFVLCTSRSLIFANTSGSKNATRRYRRRSSYIFYESPLRREIVAVADQNICRSWNVIIDLFEFASFFRILHRGFIAGRHLYFRAIHIGLIKEVIKSRGSLAFEVSLNFCLYRLKECR